MILENALQLRKNAVSGKQATNTSRGRVSTYKDLLTEVVCIFLISQLRSSTQKKEFLRNR